MAGFLSGLGGLFETKAVTSSRSGEGAATRHAVTGSGGSSMAGSFTSAGKWDTEKALKDGYEKSIWVFRCVDAIATNQSAIPIFVRKGDERSGTIAQFPQLVKLLNIRPNNYETAAMFRYRLSSILLLSRKGAFIEIVGSPENPESLHLIPPTHIEPIKHPTRFVSGYRIKDENNVWQEKPLQPEQVIWIRTKPHPTDPYAQMTPLVPAGVTAETDFFARMFNRNFLMNDGRPGLLVSIKGQMNQEDASEIKRRFAGGPATAGQTTVIEADGIDVADMGATPRDAQWQEITRSSKEDILLAFGVPESVMGNASGRCVDDKTEAFTKRGWVSGADLTTEDTILSCDPADGTMKWSPIHEVYRNNFYSGDMYRVKHSHMDALVTPGHNWLTTDGDLVKVEDLSKRSRLVLMGDAQQSNEETYDDSFVELMGWTVTEGHYGGKNSAYVRIRQNDGANSIRIEDALIRAGAQYSTHLADGRWLFNVRGSVAEELESLAPNKIMSNTFIDSLTTEQRQLLMDTMIDGDGCRQLSTKSLTFAQKDRRASEAFVYLATLCGYSTSMRERFYTYRHKGVSEVRSDWIVIVRSRKVFTTQRDTITVEHYDGAVWCPRTDYGTFVARREGRVFVTGNTFDNADAEYESFWIHTMKPHCEFISGGLDVFTGNLSDETVVAYDYHTVDVLQRQERLRHQTAIEQWTAGAITWNEMRKEIGRNPWKDALGARIIVLPSGFAMAEVGTDQAAIMKLPNVNSGPPEPNIEEEARKGALKGVAVGQRHLGNDMAARALRSVKQLELKQLSKPEPQPAPEPDIVDAVVVHPYAQTRMELESALDGVLTGFDMRQEDICTDRLNHAKVRKDTRHWEGETKAFKALDPYYVVEVDRWAGEMRNTFDRVLRPTLVKEAQRIARDMDRQGVLSRLVDDGTATGTGRLALGRLIGSQADQKALIDSALEDVLDVVETSTRNQSNRIAKKIEQLDAEGKSLEEIKREVKALVGTRFTWRKSLASHVTTAAVESIKSELYGLGGDYITKQWNCEEDERVRPTHRDVDGETKSASDAFEVGSTMMMFPGDPLAPVEEVANCRCWLSWSAN